MFQGYSQETFEFFMAIRFNNNREFFQSSRDWYLRAVRNPSLALAETLDPVVAAIDDGIERRPNRVVSRINRDTRFSRDKSPYRDYIWLSFKRPTEQKSATMGFYFDVSDEGASYGMGFYGDNRPLMDALRQKLAADPETFLEIWRPLEKKYSLYANTYKRMAVPENIPPEIENWYRARGFYIARSIRDFDLIKSPALADVIRAGFEEMAPLYQYMMALEPETETGEIIDPWKDFAQYI